MTATSEMCDVVHMALERLPLTRYPFDIDDMPDAGVYFFYEDGESWGHCDGEKPRIVRVGTHRKNNFHSRMRDHYTSDSRSMNLDTRKSLPHDRSIFRKNLGRAILNKEGNPYLNVWNIDFTTREAREKKSYLRNVEEDTRIEVEVTKLLRERFSFRFVVLEEEEKRLDIESKIIGTLHGCPCCKSSKNWLGLHSPVNKIREGGMWMTQHLESDGLAVADMALFSEAVNRTTRWMKGLS